MKSLLKPVLDAEERTAVATIKKYGKLLALVDRALELFIDRTNLFYNKKFGSLSKLQAARLHLTVRSIKSLRMAKVALVTGYYQQAITLIRMAAEDNLVARDAEICSATLDALLLDVPLKEDDNVDIQIDRFGAMAKRQSIEFKKWWDWYYGRLSIFGAHPRNASMSNLGHHIPTERGYILKIEPFEDEDSIEPLLSIAAAELWRMFETTHELVNSAVSDNTILEEPELSWTRKGLIELGSSLYKLGYKYIFRLEDWEGSEGVERREG